MGHRRLVVSKEGQQWRAAARTGEVKQAERAQRDLRISPAGKEETPL